VSDFRLGLAGLCAALTLQGIAVLCMLAPGCGGDESRCYVDTPHDGRIEVQCAPESAWAAPSASKSPKGHN
jgi:hypothetical protein